MVRSFLSGRAALTQLMADSIPYLLKPGLHSYNIGRIEEPAPVTALSKFRIILTVIGVICLAYFAYTWADQKIYQSYQNWAFDRQLSKSAPVTPASPAEGAVIGRIEISRLKLSAMVRQGVSDETLREAVGHVPSTAMPGQSGNFAIAAHRDTLFRALKDVKLGDRITFQTQTGLFTYEVAGTKIVRPSDVSVLRPDGGGVIESGNGKLLTMITCYPFYYVGSAPKRFIVEAKLVE